MLGNGKWSKGQLTIGGVAIGLILSAVLVIFLVPMMAPVGARSLLEGQGYVVLAAGEYSDLMTLLESIDTKADAAVVNAEAAVTAAELAATNAEAAVTAAELAVTNAEAAATKVDLFNTADTFLFPEDTDYWVLLTANAVAGSFSSWTEIADNNSVTLSSLFAADAGYISDIYIYQVTAPADTTHIVEIAYGVGKTSITRIMFNGDNLNIAQIKSRRIPAGETVYYRIMTNTAPTEYVSIGFRYFYE
jgi:Tfp pilus assembly protein PilX